MIEIIQQGILTTIQGKQREGYRSLGISLTGGLDSLSLQLANILVANTRDKAVLEITLGQFSAKFNVSTWIAITGAQTQISLDEKKLSIGWCYPVKAGQTLTIDRPNIGMRNYLAVSGGFNAMEYLNSPSTDLNTKLGGFNGRALEKGDILTINSTSVCPKSIKGILLPTFKNQIRAIPATEYSQFSKQSQYDFWHNSWQLTTQSSRMGFRLSGSTLKRESSIDMMSHGVIPGVIQVPPNGQPIVLMQDAQTTGGYPKFACIIEADLNYLAQIRLGDLIQFKPCSLEEAYLVSQEQDIYLNKVERGLYENRFEC
ncbi:5-oxoprolinase subunit C family protein [Thorsellia kenyensis]|uniref:Biotin-dependent carboxyltransferase family protein n=1 Tax=Thorsellia kenyensis TaxID=1549888 RepID=A0ABV6CCT6_9GAMM